MSSGVAIGADNVIIHEGYLFKTPPLDKLFMSWKKRWFELSRQNPQDPTSLELIYYTDASKKDKLKSIDVRQIKTINPVHSKSKENVFSLELMDSKKFMLRSADKQGKAIWVAKLLECCSKDGMSVHVTVPSQPTASYSECILKVTTPLKINVISSCTGEPVMTIPYNKIRRFGCQIAVESDIVWFETCGCHGDAEEFQFFIVAMGIEKAYQIVQEYKRSIELALRDHLIMEEGDQSQFLYSYVLKSHYGHMDYPTIGREKILQSGLMSLSTSGGSLSLSELNKFARSRTSLPYIHAPKGPIPGDMGEKSVPNALGLIRRSPSPSPQSPTSPTRQNGKMSLDQLQCPRPSRSSTGTRGEFDSGVNMDPRPLDPSRHSAPCYFPAQSSPKQSSKYTLEAMKKARSFDEKPLQPGRVTLNNFKATGKSLDESKHRKRSLADLQVRGVSAYSKSPQLQVKGGYDSAVGSASDLHQSPPYSAGREGAAYDIAKSHLPYDHL